ncbi:response regulator [Candidatus Poribacteria bacterium]|nr:response regulator [Candidatus Poribacteria bacterium]
MVSQVDMPESSLQKKFLVLIVDDHKLSRELFKAYLTGAGYDTVEAKNGEDALSKLKEYSPDVVVLDIVMPVLDGYEVCRRIKEDPRTTLLPVIMVTGLDDFEAKMKALALGADDYINKPLNEQELLMRVSNHLRIKQLTDQLESAENVIITLIGAVEAKDPYTRGHSERVAEYSCKLGRKAALNAHELQVLRRAALLHDVGKIGVDDAIIRSRTKLTTEQLEKVQDHPSIGIDIIRSLSSLSDVFEVIESHHERFDGAGYPGRLAREDIPIAARIIAVADTFDALTTDRPYRRAVGVEEAFKEMRQSARTGQLDPKLVEEFIEAMSL